MGGKEKQLWISDVITFIFYILSLKHVQERVTEIVNQIAVLFLMTKRECEATTNVSSQPTNSH